MNKVRRSDIVEAGFFGALEEILVVTLQTLAYSSQSERPLNCWSWRVFQTVPEYVP